MKFYNDNWIYNFLIVRLKTYDGTDSSFLKWLF